MTKNELRIIKTFFKTDDKIELAIQEYQQGRPLAYILGEWYFYGLTFKLDDTCMIPRADTEHIVEKAIQLIPKDGHFADLCAGSGCIAISILKNRPDLTCEAIEISPRATSIATNNAIENLVNDRLIVKCGDVYCNEFPDNIFDVIVSNPPYIRTNMLDKLDEYVKKEPRSALNGGRDGLDFYRCILEDYKPCLKRDGKFIFEIGYDQKADIERLAEFFGYKNCVVSKDYGGNDRVAVIY